MGEYDGKIETNSQEAFISSWENGYRVMEADFIYTSDGVLVVRHDFDKDGSYYRLEIEPGSNLVMDSNTFQNKKIIYEQTPMTVSYTHLDVYKRQDVMGAEQLDNVIIGTIGRHDEVLLLAGRKRVRLFFCHGMIRRQYGNHGVFPQGNPCVRAVGFFAVQAIIYLPVFQKTVQFLMDAFF